LEHVLQAVGRGGDLARILEDAASDAKAAVFFTSPAVPNSADEILAGDAPAR
jgi:hypothetical protein